MKRILIIISVAIIFLTANAETFAYQFSNTPLSKAIQKISEDHPGLDINFIYNELEDYITNSTVNTDNVYQALRQAIGQNPVSVIKSGNSYYIEAIQHGRHIFTGKLVDQDNEPVVAATVLLLAPKDSTVITYGITDNTGQFSIPCNRKNVLARLSCIGYETTYMKFDSPSVGNITIHLNPIKLNETIVKADELTVGHDKIMLNVDNSLRKHSFDGYSLLNVAMIPGLDVNPFERTVQSEGQNVLLCINGVEASQGEIRTLNPKDVLRIDFYTGYDPRHPDRRFTLDFIVKIRDYGGAVIVNSSQHLNKPTGWGMADWRMYKGNTEFGVRIDENFDSYAQGLYEEDTDQMAFESGDVLISTREFIDRNRNQSLRAKPYLIYRKNNSTLKLTFAIQQEHTHTKSTDIEEYIRHSEVTVSDAKITSHTDRLLPAMSGMYQHKFSNTRYLNIFLNGNCSKTNTSRDYLSLHDIMSHTRENFYGGSASAQYSFGFTDTQNAFISVNGGIGHSRIHYDENEASSLSRLTNKYITFSIGDNWRVCRALSLYLMLGGELEDIDNYISKSTQFTFIPNLRVNWTIANGNTLNYNFSIRNKRPPMSYYSPDEKWVMQYLRLRGNPDLKMSRQINTYISYRNVRDWGYMGLFGAYTGVSRSVYFDFRCDNSRDVYIKTFRNGGFYHDISAGPSIQLKIIPKHLTLRIGGEWNYVRTVTYKPLHRHTFSSNANIMFTAGGFSANLTCSTPAKRLSVLGGIDYVPWTMQLTAGYTINNWSMEMIVKNPFMTAQTWCRGVLPGINTISRFYSPRTRYNRVAVNVGYRFSYGKPKNKYEEVKLEEQENSAILGY